MRYTLFVILFLSWLVSATSAPNLSIGRLQVYAGVDQIQGCKPIAGHIVIEGPVVIMRSVTDYGHWCWVAKDDSLDSIYSLWLTAKATGKKINILSSYGIGEYVEVVTGVELSE